MSVSPEGKGWKVVFPGVPEGFEPGLSRIDDSTFVIERGPFGGAVVWFEDDDTAHAGPIPIKRLNGEYREPPGYGLPPPAYSPDAQRDQAFRALLDKTDPGGRINWDLPHPKHEFVRWAQGLDRFIFHSSTNTAIEEFQPKRDSMELSDHGGRGNLGAVYGTHDGYWSMFFGIVDRTRLRGSMRNGVYRWEAPDGRRTTTYQFSLEQETLAGRPFTEGAVYLLPRDTFRRLRYYPGGPVSEEWASEEPLQPVASLLIIPRDFPFLDSIAGHDESDFLAMSARFRQLIGNVISYEGSEQSGLRVRLAWNEDAQTAYQEWSRRAEQYMSAVEHRLEDDGPEKVLRLDGPPPYLNGVRGRLDEIMES